MPLAASPQKTEWDVVLPPRKLMRCAPPAHEQEAGEAGNFGWPWPSGG